MNWRWEQLPPPGTRARVHLLAFCLEPRPGVAWTQIDEPLRELASRDLALDVGAAQYAESISADVLDPLNLEFIRDAWRRAAECNAAFVLDVLARRWWTALPLERPFFLENELSLDFQGAPTGKLGHLAHTVGMAKFGRPELAIAGLEPRDGPLGAALLLKAARIYAGGASLPVGPRIFDLLRLERNKLPIAAPHLVLRDSGMGPPTIRKYLALRRG